MSAVVDHPRQKVPNRVYRRALNRIAAGDTIQKACNRLQKTEPHAPIPTGFLKWCMKTPERWEQYTRALEISTELMAHELDTLAARAGEDCTDPAMITAQVNRARLRIDTRKWTMSKRSPKRYGDKLQHEHTGSIAIAVVTGVALDNVKDAQYRIAEGDNDAAQIEMSNFGTAALSHSPSDAVTHCGNADAADAELLGPLGGADALRRMLEDMGQ